jgi:phosphate starvation-inducible PhoH-like protein
MKMFLTRLGRDAQAVVTGDITQIDLPAGQTSGLVEAARLLRDIPGIAELRFTKEDVVRHRLVAAIIDAYERKAVREAARRGDDTPAPTVSDPGVAQEEVEGELEA